MSDPVSAANEAGKGYKAGIGTTVIGGKFDFYGDERRGISVAVYPQLEFAAAHGAEVGLSKAGQTIVLPLLATHIESHERTRDQALQVNSIFFDVRP